MKNTRKDKNLIFDVGMHKGEDTDYYLKKGFNVISFEADPDLAADCRRRFADEIKDGRLVIVEGAIIDLPPEGTEVKTVKFYKSGNTVWGTVADEFAQRNEKLKTPSEIIYVPAVNFSQCLEKYGIPHYLKIDIEGMDTVCLKALLNFEQKPDYISIEAEKVSFSKLTEEFNLLTKLGYSKFQAVQQLEVSRQKEPNPSREGRYANYQFQEGATGLFGEDLPRKWKNYDQILNEYKKIFWLYKVFDDYKVMNSLVIRASRKALSLLLRKPIPGWHDTHAKHSSIDY